jgi:hypothetical protein
MQTLKILGFLATIGLIAASTACNKKSPNPQEECIEGVVIAEARKMNENPDLSMICFTVVQIKNRNIGVNWKGFNNCVVIENLDKSKQVVGTKIFFKNYSVIDEWGYHTDCFPPPNVLISIQNQCNLT